ncbi:acyltransferase [Phytoactinopolyspora alkaliphila]|uniref:Acyltransferase n=1 Tax=Phytoactinopolyspora alkaliphila TaxID=1783498 RepID=A0A6N9YRH2_9ACTN|nr:acyltransferase [Phytoactinopolyspora alkaliphila]NED97428.1 acyltransferase [Phytoactinopolyspora alkaliphila]
MRVHDPRTMAGHLLDYNAWAFWAEADDEQRRQQLEYQASFVARGVARFSDRGFVSPLAACYPDDLVVGENSYIAAYAYVTGTVHLGSDTTVNAYAVVRGDVRLGSGVRIGAHSSLLGFNHSMEPDRPVFKQATTTVGITVGDDVWIGSNVVVVDGVTIGEHSVIGAGAVVTKDVPPWSVMAGNPARQLRDRRDTRVRRGSDTVLRDRLKALADRARAEIGNVLARCWDDGVGWFVDRPGERATVRAMCDAVEIADLLAGGSLPQLSSDEIVRRLRSMQDPQTGLVPQIGDEAAVLGAGPDLGDGLRYHILSAGYALRLLGSSFEHPISVVDDLRPDELICALEALPWAQNAWHAGDWVDGYGTGLYWNEQNFGRRGALETLIGWLHTHVHPDTGMWGRYTAEDGRRQMVNGYYRLTRGTFAQFHLPVPHPEAVIDTVLAHSRDGRWFGDDKGTACDVLDVIHPLWLAGAQTQYRRAEAQTWARAQLDRVLGAWRPDAGFSFTLRDGAGFDGEPGLQGTEMWLAIAWYLADLLGCADALGYTPRGVHRPDSASR